MRELSHIYPRISIGIFMPVKLKPIRVMVLLSAPFVLGACTSMKVPDLDFIKLPEFREEAENIGGYPKVEDAPETPVAVKTDAEWDQAAKNIIARRDGFVSIGVGDTPKTDAEIEKEIDDLVAKVEEYKLDDPQ